MTDYASQGKTREVNVVDIANSKNHQAVYTALSRGKLADSTLILRDFPTAKVKGQMNGYLRGEYRAIESLDEITDLHYKGELPEGIIQRLRDSTIAAYTEYRGVVNNPTVQSGKKRKSDTQMDLARRRKRARAVAPSSTDGSADTTSSDSDYRIAYSWSWDSIDWSCACDSILTVLLSVWIENPVAWYGQLKAYSLAMQTILAAFESLDNNTSSLEEVRSEFRSILWRTDPISFPRGPNGTDLLSLAQLLVGMRPEDGNVNSVRQCVGCDDESMGGVYEAIGKYVIVYEDGSVRGSVEEYLRLKETEVSPCRTCGLDAVLRSHYAPLMVVQLPYAPGHNEGTVLSPVVKLKHASYRLRGVVYGSAAEQHFNARLVARNGEVFRYDDMIQRGRIEIEGMITSSTSSRWLGNAGRKEAHVAVYVREG
jgi:hypothetical protein